MRKRPLARGSWLGFVAVLGAACATSTASPELESLRRAVALGDPAFGGGASLEGALWSVQVRPAGDPAERATFVRRWRERADREALQLAHELVSDEQLVAAAGFLDSPAARRFWVAEQRVLQAAPFLGEELPAALAEACRDPGAVGEAGLRRILDLFGKVADGSVSLSPSQGAIALGAASLSTEDAQGIAEFAATPAGRAWFATVTAAFARTMARRNAFCDEARQRGFLETAPGFLDLAVELPKELPVVEEAQPAFTIVLDDDRCWRVDGALLARADDNAALRAGVLALRERGLASGRFSTEPVEVDGRRLLRISEHVRIEAPKNTPWETVGALLKVCADPEIAIVAVELAVDPSIVPPSMFRPSAR